MIPEVFSDLNDSVILSPVLYLRVRCFLLVPGRHRQQIHTAWLGDGCPPDTSVALCGEKLSLRHQFWRRLYLHLDTSKY